MQWSKAWETAEAQNGALAMTQFAEAGVPDRTARARRAAEGLRRPQARVILAPGAPDSWEARARAALLQAGPRSALGGLAALHVHGLAPPPTQVDVAIPYDRNVRLRPPAKARRSRTLLAADITRVNSFSCTTIERTLFDVAAWEPTIGGAHALVLDAIQQRRTTARRVLERGAAKTPLRGRSAVIEAARAADRGIHSTFESRVLEQLRRARLPAPTSQCPIEVEGRTVHLDFGWPGLGVGVECVGLRAHNDRDALRRDLRRLNTLRGSSWRIIWVEWSRLLGDPDGLVEEIRRELSGADGS